MLQEGWKYFFFNNKILSDFRRRRKSRCVGLSWICSYNNGVVLVLTLGLDFIDWLCFVYVVGFVCSLVYVLRSGD